MRGQVDWIVYFLDLGTLVLGPEACVFVFFVFWFGLFERKIPRNAMGRRTRGVEQDRFHLRVSFLSYLSHF